jgi:hypothetical protein
MESAKELPFKVGDIWTLRDKKLANSGEHYLFTHYKHLDNHYSLDMYEVIMIVMETGEQDTLLLRLSTVLKHFEKVDG